MGDLAPPARSRLPILYSPLSTYNITYYTYRQDNIGSAGFVADYFAADEPMVISSRYPFWTITKKNRRDPTTAFGNTRGVPLPEWYKEDILAVGGLRFDVDRASVHETGDYLIFLDKGRVKNANEGKVSYQICCTAYAYI